MIYLISIPSYFTSNIHGISNKILTVAIATLQNCFWRWKGGGGNFQKYWVSLRQPFFFPIFSPENFFLTIDIWTITKIIFDTKFKKKRKISQEIFSLKFSFHYLKNLVSETQYQIIRFIKNLAYETQYYEICPFFSGDNWNRQLTPLK